MQKGFTLRLMAILVSANSVFFAVSGCRDSQENAGPNTPTSVAVSTVQRGDISHVLSLAGQFQPYQVVDVWSARLEMCQWIRENWTRRAYGTRQEVPA
jgi:hypothetical protein